MTWLFMIMVIISFLFYNTEGLKMSTTGQQQQFPLFQQNRLFHNAIQISHNSKLG